MGERIHLVHALRDLPDGCRDFVEKTSEAFFTAPGSSAVHQAWIGGYADHVDEVLGIAHTLYGTLSAIRPLPFEPYDYRIVLFLHDCEKVFRNLPTDVKERLDQDPNLRELGRYAEHDPLTLKELVLGDYGIELTDEQDNALRYVHGELDDYTGKERKMGPLAAFCHCCDNLSARLWFDEPRKSGPIPGALL